MARDWYAWHAGYEDPQSSLSRRLDVVRTQVRLALDQAAAGPLRVLSLVAGQGRDLIPELTVHSRRDDVTATLVELDPRNAQVARDLADAAGLSQVDIRTADASQVDNFSDAVPADLVLLCGLFGNVSDVDIERTVAHTAAMTRRGGTVIWTRHREEPDLVPRIDGWFVESGFERVWLSPRGTHFGVGVHRATGDPGALAAGTELFTFVWDGPSASPKGRPDAGQGEVRVAP